MSRAKAKRTTHTDEQVRVMLSGHWSLFPDAIRLAAKERGVEFYSVTMTSEIVPKLLAKVAK